MKQFPRCNQIGFEINSYVFIFHFIMWYSIFFFFAFFIYIKGSPESLFQAFQKSVWLNPADSRCNVELSLPRFKTFPVLVHRWIRTPPVLIPRENKTPSVN